GSPEGFAHKSSVLEGHCRDLGRDYAEITRSANYNVVIGRDEAEVADRLEQVRARVASVAPEKADEVVEGLRSGPAVGTPEQVVEKLREVGDLGMTYAITYFAEAAYDTSGIELFEREVVPALA
ncbi:LLM class F420-dependent oxidoreductase, partial [Pseudokineococcus marinus]|nr:LLM class F420-dependent oxidoreductase [Pseudokineococcus marinus]